MTHRILLAGFGNMGRALFEGWHLSGLVAEAVIVEPSPFGDPPAQAVMVPDEAAIPSGFEPDMVVLAVKPQVMAEVLPHYRNYTGYTAFLSIAAGKTIGFFEQHLGPQAAIVRAMPNLPATVRLGTTAVCANAAVNPGQRAMATALLEAVGAVHWVEEGQIDAISALSGSGPAYVFLLQEVLARAAETLGIDPMLAVSLARSTIAGSAVMLNGAAEPASELRRRVTSPGGTTEAACKILLEDDALSTLYTQALQAAVRRAGELAL